MREIKYEGWDGKQLLKVVRIHLDDDGAIFWSPNGNSNPIYNITEYPLRQYTGPKDKNGKEIYEGDIVKALMSYSDTNEPIIRPVAWWEPTLQWVIKHPKSDFLQEGFDLLVNAELEVIGNIYENPELLKGVPC